MSRVNAGGCCDCQLGDMRSSSARAILPLFPRLAAIIVLSATGVLAQESLYPGEAYVTRFSGTVSQDGRAVIDTKGSVGSVIDIRQPGGAPRGGHWSNEPQRLSVTAGEIGQVFGIALDEDSPPNIYLTATSAFGLHRTPDNSDWMAGMWGPGGGPGTIWKLSAANNYRPEVFAQIALDHRANTGAALGNAAYDRWNRQFYVSDLETGMIHRLRLSDGVDLGRYDHGAQGRASFFDARVGASQSLPTVAFNPGSGARISDCAAGTFANHPSCWNFADFRRRVWGLGVRRDGGTGDVRLFYSVWGSQGFGEPAWFTAGDDQRNSVWSVRIGPDGSFDASDVRLEFILPNFFSDPAQIASLGASHPVSDIAFPKLGEQNVMLLAERGGVRNLGLDASAPFARPHESRVLRYDVDERGVWRSAGRYDVGYYDRKNDGQPYLRANASGGVDFGLGYGADWRADQDKADEFVWMTGDSLCSPDGPCADPAAGSPAGTTQVHGIQGTPIARVDDLAPDAALMPYPDAGYATPADTPGASYMIDTDADAKDQRDDATKIGDVEVHEYEPRPEGVAEGWMPPGWTPPDWTAPPGYVPAPGWVPPPGWTPPPDWTQPPGWIAPPWWIVPPTLLPVEPVGLDLELKKAMPSVGVGPGAGMLVACSPTATCKFQVTITNKGPGTHSGPLTVKDTIPTGWKFVSAPPPWTCQQQGDAFSCAHPQATLAPGKSVTLDVELQPVAAAGGQSAEVENCAEIDWKGPGDGNKSNDRGCQKLTLGTAPSDLAIWKSGPKECVRNTICAFTITIANVGKGPYQGPISFEEPHKFLPGLTVKKVSPSPPWHCTDAQLVIRCDHPNATLAPGAKLTLNLDLFLPADIPASWDTLHNCVKITKSVGAVSKPEGCTDTPLKAEFDLKITKTGPAKCAEPDTCYFFISVWNKGKADYEGPISITETSQYPDLKLGSVKPSPPWTCSESSGKAAWPVHEVTCTHPSVKIGGMTGVVGPLTLQLGLGDTTLTEFKNCAKVGYKGGKPDADPTNDQVCITTPLGPSGGTLTGGVGPHWEISLTGIGTLSCLIGPCTDYDFTISNAGPSIYSLPMTLRVKLPEGAKLKSARGTQSGKSCLAGGWSCGQSGEEVVCLPSDCSLGKGEKTAVHFDMRLLPEGAPPPPDGTIKTVCGELEWFAPPSTGVDIEQQAGGKKYSRACVSTKILVGKEFDLALKKSGPAECSVGGTCSYSLTVRNTSQTPFSGPIKIVDELPSGWKLESAGSTKCTQDGDRVTCEHLKLTLQPNWTETITINARVPEREKRSEAENCASLEPAKGESDANRANDKSCVMTKIGRKRVPTEEECSAGERWDGKRCVPKEELQRCPRGQIRVDGRCVCPEGQRWDGKRCVTKKEVRPCPPGQSRVDGRCVCPEDQHWDGERCVPSCTGGRVWTGNACECPPGTVEKRGRCVVPAPEPCTGGKVRVGDRCVCPENTVERRGLCVPKQAEVPKPPQIIIPKLVLPPAAPQIRPQMIPTPLQIICPAGTVWSDHYKKCMPVVE